MRMLTARHKIATKDAQAEPWSIRYPLACSELNQGCNGGYGVLVAKWSETYGLVRASCGRYSDAAPTQCPFGQAASLLQTFDDNISTESGYSSSHACRVSTHGQTYRAANHRYVGGNGAYGFTSEDAMKEELVAHGPFVVGIEPGTDFMMYESGIFDPLQGKVDHRHHGLEQGVWERVDHAVVLIGWGEEQQENGEVIPYWLVQNSWGPDWGEDGYFRIRRGLNVIGVEGIGEAADVVADNEGFVHDV